MKNSNNVRFSANVDRSLVKEFEKALIDLDIKREAGTERALRLFLEDIKPKFTMPQEVWEAVKAASEKNPYKT